MALVATLFMPEWKRVKHPAKMLPLRHQAIHTVNPGRIVGHPDIGLRVRIPSIADHDSEVQPINRLLIGWAAAAPSAKAKQAQENKQEKTTTTEISSPPEAIDSGSEC